MQDDFIDPPQPRNASQWVRLASAARYVGVDPDTLAAWCLRGDVPVTLIQRGPRLRYVNAVQFENYIDAPRRLYTRADLELANRQYPPVQRQPENLFE